MGPNRWFQGPPFLLHPPSEWPLSPSEPASDDDSELRKSAFCGLTTSPSSTDEKEYRSWQEQVEATAEQLHKDSNLMGHPPAETYREAERHVFMRAQMDCFPEDYHLLRTGKTLQHNSRLLCLSPEFDESSQLIRVGGRLRRVEILSTDVVHSIVLDPKHRSCQLLIKDYDDRLHHPGPERVYAELRRKVWVLRGREAIKKHQRSCFECCKLKTKPATQKMGDLPPARLQLFKPAFYSTGMDCFGPLTIKIGRRNEKRWGLLFKCLTTRAVHLEVLTSIDSDAFLMALRRFIARRGTPHELHSDHGTNFHGGQRELETSFNQLGPQLQEILAKRQINFIYNPPAAPHFGGAWEREIRSVKTALRATLEAETVTEEVLTTVLVEIEAILNSKPLGYVSSDLSDLDPVTPNFLLMGRPDTSLPQVVYPASELLSKRRWRHVQVLAERFWSAFTKYYLLGQQTRGKWQSSLPNIQDGAIVMMVDPQLPRSAWQIGKVIKVFPGADGRVRSAEVQIQDRVYTRPITRLVVLPEVLD